MVRARAGARARARVGVRARARVRVRQLTAARDALYLRISPHISVYLPISAHHEDELAAAREALLLEHAADGGDLLR